MGLDLEKLSPAPWFARGEGICCAVYQGTTEKQGYLIDLQDPTWADAEFIALARNAFDVMLRRGWHAMRDVQHKWFAVDERSRPVHPSDDYRSEDGRFNPVRLADPFSALVAADEWYRNNVETVAVAESNQ